jgi:membrane glycosyltransferase
MDRVTSRPAAAPRTGARPPLQILPPRAPLDMPVQSLRSLRARRRARFADSVAWRRVAILGLTALMTLGAGAVMFRLLRPGGFELSDAMLLGLFTILFAWVAFAMIGAGAGFALLWAARELQPWRPQPTIFTRTALLMPTYGEDPGRVLAGVQAIYEDLEARGVVELYDIFILSDTRAGVIAKAEVQGVLRLRGRLNAADRIFYRRRAINLDRKAGNIADWVQRFGGAYEAMIILDADSLMTGDTIVRLTAAMERDPRVGLIQTLPTIIGATTLFGRIQQFAGRIYGPIIAEGQAWWSGSEGNYWGHNAILRTRAFAACAGLPHIGGRHPFSGHIMSHDFVEAALLRRGGWAVRMAAGLPGSYEETPPSLLDMAVRDRRWCQGNLQHTALLAARGLHWVSRLHLLRGVLAYLTAPLWLAFLAMGDIVWAQQRHAGEAADVPLAGALFGLTFSLLLLPKVLGAVLTAHNRLSRRACGGGVRLGASVLIEIVFSVLMSPVLMLLQSHAIVEVLCGRHSGWAAQRRDDQRLSLRAAWRRHWAHTLLGVCWAVGAVALDPVLLAWTSPVTIGLVLAVPVSILTSRVDLGQACRRMGLFVTPEETTAPPVMARAAHLRGVYESEASTRARIDQLFREPVRMWMPALPWAQIV